MKVLMTTWGSRGDVEPLAALAVELHSLGVETVVAAPPDVEFAELLDRVGVEHLPLGPSVRSIVTAAKPPSAKEAFRLAPELVRARFETLLPAALDCDALLATGLMPAGARSVAEKLGLRYVYACFHTYGLPSPHFPAPFRPGQPPTEGESDSEALWEAAAQRVDALYGEALNHHRAALELPPVSNVRDYVFSDQPWLAADPLLAPWPQPATLDVVTTGAWILPDDRPLPNALAAFLESGPPPVYVGFGSMAMRGATDLAPMILEAVRTQGRRLILARGWAELALVAGLTDCVLVGEVNQQQLFARVAAVVHHGGAGTTTTAARAGLPQVIIPQFADQPSAALRVVELGIGAAHDGPLPSVASLSAALEIALGETVGRNAEAVSRMIRIDGAAVAARMLVGDPPKSQW